MFRVIIVTLSLVLSHFALTAVLPKYFTLCKKGSPDLAECLVNNAKTAIEQLTSVGDPNLKVNSLTPIKIQFIDLQATPNLKVVLNDCEFMGFQNMEMLDASFSDDELVLKGHSDKLVLLSKYDVKGQILILPIQGVGDINVTVINVVVTYTAKLQQIDKDGEKHYKIESSNVNFEPERIYWHLANLFNGDKRLGDEMNKFLNEGWNDVFDEVRGAIESTVARIYDGYISIYFDKLASNQLLE